MYPCSAWFIGVLWYMYHQYMVSCACKGACVCTCAFRQNTYPGQRLLLVERLLRLQGAVLVTVGQKGTSWGKEEKPIYDMKLGPTVIDKISLLQTLLSIALPLLFFFVPIIDPVNYKYIYTYIENHGIIPPIIFTAYYNADRCSCDIDWCEWLVKVHVQYDVIGCNIYRMAMIWMFKTKRFTFFFIINDKSEYCWPKAFSKLISIVPKFLLQNDEFSEATSIIGSMCNNSKNKSPPKNEK